MRDRDPTWRIETLAVQAGEGPAELTGPVAPPIYQTSTYRQDAVGVPRDGWEYARTQNPTRSRLERAVAALEGGSHGLAFASGSATTAVIAELAAPGDEVIVSDDVYGGTFRLFERVLRAKGVDARYVDLTGDPAGALGGGVPLPLGDEIPGRPLRHGQRRAGHLARGPPRAAPVPAERHRRGARPVRLLPRAARAAPAGAAGRAAHRERARRGPRVGGASGRRRGPLPGPRGGPSRSSPGRARSAPDGAARRPGLVPPRGAGRPLPGGAGAPLLRSHTPLHPGRIARRRGVAVRGAGGHDARLGGRLGAGGACLAGAALRGHRARGRPRGRPRPGARSSVGPKDPGDAPLQDDPGRRGPRGRRARPGRRGRRPGRAPPDH